MRRDLLAYFFTAFVFLSMDAIWLSLSAGPVYRARLGSLMLEKPNLAVAAAFYLIYIIPVIIFAVLPALEADNWCRALWAAALLGFTAYGTYDLTNQATLAGWSTFVSLVDMAWGTFATATAATAGYFITRALD